MTRSKNTNRANTDILRKYYRERKAEDPTFRIPSVRFAPDGFAIDDILEYWVTLDHDPADGGQDPFTDIEEQGQPLSKVEN
jgi:hypothetical protein